MLPLRCAFSPFSVCRHDASYFLSLILIADAFALRLFRCCYVSPFRCCLPRRSSRYRFVTMLRRFFFFSIRFFAASPPRFDAATPFRLMPDARAF